MCHIDLRLHIKNELIEQKPRIGQVPASNLFERRVLTTKSMEASTLSQFIIADSLPTAIISASLPANFSANKTNRKAQLRIKSHVAKD